MFYEDADYELNSLYDHKLGMFSPAEIPGHSDYDDDFPPTEDYVPDYPAESHEIEE